MRNLITTFALLLVAIAIIGCGEKYPQEIKVGFSGTPDKYFSGGYANSDTTIRLDTLKLPKNYTINLESKTDSVWAWGKLTRDTIGKLIITLKDKDDKVLKQDSVMNDTTRTITVKYKK